ncbi:MAG TPA: ABC transporter permease [Acidimicrobiales bacterium]|nr:ABC transporter permease [Acidimicrobiales bacterium]
MDAFIGYTIAGLAIGAIYAIAATGLVVTYTTSGVFNFAHGATGMLAAFLYWQLRVQWHWAAPVALFVVLFVAAPLYGMAVERILIRPLDPSDTGTTMVVTVGLMIFSLGLAYTVWPYSNRVLVAFFGPGAFVQILGNRVSYQELITIGLAAVVALSLRFLFFRTRIGVAMRGVVDDRPLMALNGGYPTRLNALSWTIGAGLAALAGVLQASGPTGGGLQVLDLTFLVVNAYAAALLGRMKSLPLTFAGAMSLGLLVQYVTGYVTLSGWMSNLKPVLPTFFLFAILLVLRPVRLRSAGTRSTNTLPVPSLRRSLVGAATFLVGAIVVEQFMHGQVLIAQTSEGVAVSVTALSVVLLTGYGGQVSLAPYAFMGFGAWLFGALSPGGSILGLVGVGVISGGLGALVALPSLRLRDLYLALSTLAFGELAYFLFFSQPSVMGANDRRVPRVHLPGLSLAGAKSELFFECVMFAVFAVAILAVRRGSIGRLLIATRDSQAACATLGANLNLTKLLLFASSASIAGIGGALWGGVEREVNSNNFLFQLSLSLVLLVYIWGVSSPAGALIAGLVFSVGFGYTAHWIDNFFSLVDPHLVGRFSQSGLILTGLGAMSLARFPNGTIGQISDSWQGLLAGRGRPTAPAAADLWAPPNGSAAIAREEVRDLVPAADR